MNDNKTSSDSNAPEISEDEFRLLEAYVDEELSIREVDKLERKLAANPALSAALDDVESMRKVFQHCFTEEVRVRSAQFDCWSEVQSRILAEQKGGLIQRWGYSLKEFLASPGPSNGAFAALSVCAVAAITFAFSARSNYGSSLQTGSPLQVAALSGETFGGENSPRNQALDSHSDTAGENSGLERRELDLASGNFSARDFGSQAIPVQNVSFGGDSQRASRNFDFRDGDNLGSEPSAFASGYGDLRSSLGSDSRQLVLSNGGNFGEPAVVSGLGTSSLGGSSRGVTIPLPNARQLAALRELASAPDGSPVGMSVQLMITPKGRAARLRAPNFAALENRMNYLRSGISTPAAEIDWARSDNTLNIVPTSRTDSVPVIWVSGRKQSRSFVSR